MKKVYLFLLSLVLILPSVLPLFRDDFFKMHDYTHVARLVELDKAVKDGHIPPRWSEDLGWGYGMPLFNFYAPLPYFIAEVFHLLGFSFLLSIKAVFFLTFLLAFWGMYFLVNYYFGSLAGILGATAFVYSPYRALDFYVRGSLGELFAISLLPLAVFLLAKLVNTYKKKYLVLGTLSLGALFISHTVLAMVGMPVLFLVSLLFVFLNKKKLKSLLLVFTQFVLGFCLAAFFLLPAYFEKEYTKVGILTQGYSDYNHHFLYFRQFIFGKWGYGESVTGIADTISFKLGIGQVLLAVLTLLFAFLKVLKNKFEKKEVLLFAFALLTGLLAFLSTYHAKFIWDKAKLMAFIQFPWRLNSFIIIFLSFLAGGFLFYLKDFFSPFKLQSFTFNFKNFKKELKEKLSWSLTLFLSTVLIFVNLSYFKPKEYIRPETLYFIDSESISKVMSRIIPDFIPRWVEKEPQDIVVKEYEILKGRVDIEVDQLKTQRLKLNVKADSPVSLQLNRFYFPGWTLYINGEKAGFDYKNNNGIVNFNLENHGNYTVDLRFENTKIRRIANGLSLASLILLLGLSFLKKEFGLKG
jgi:uncharacterized membrane protein